MCVHGFKVSPYLPVVNGVKEMGIPGMKESLLYLEGPHNSTIAMEYPHFQ